MDNEVQETEEQIEETQEEQPTRESAIDTIKNKVREFFGGNQEPAEEVNVPDDFTKAALELGWSGDDVKEFAKDYTEDQLKEMIPALLGEDSSEEETTSDTETVESKETKEEKQDNSQEDERIQKLLDRIEALEKAQTKDLEEQKEQEVVDYVNRASQVFDEASKEFEVFGKTEDLPRFPDGRIIPTSPQMKARTEVWELAYRLKDTGLGFDDAMSVALNSFKGKNLASDVKRKMIKDLKLNEKRLGGKRTSHEQPGESLSGTEIIRKKLAEHGY